MIVIATPTIMDGLVIRWYTSIAAAENRDEIMSASRNGVYVNGYICGEYWITEEDLRSAKLAYDHLWRGKEDYPNSLITHRRLTGFGGPLVPIEAKGDAQ